MPDAGQFKAAFRRNARQFHYSNTLLIHRPLPCRLLLIAVAVAKSPAARYVGGVVEWLMAPVLKTGRAQALVGSNPTPSAVCEKWSVIHARELNKGYGIGQRFLVAELLRQAGMPAPQQNDVSIAECGLPSVDRAEPMHGEQRANYSQNGGDGDVG